MSNYRELLARTKRMAGEKQSLANEGQAFFNSSFGIFVAKEIGREIDKLKGDQRLAAKSGNAIDSAYLLGVNDGLTKLTDIIHDVIVDAQGTQFELTSLESWDESAQRLEENISINE